jgi:hypothetical protein
VRKKAQFFLIAALIIAILLAGLGTIYVTTRSPELEFRVYDLSKEIDFEASQVIDNGVATANTREEIEKRIQELTTNYARLNPNSDIAIYYGDLSGVYVITYEVQEAGRAGFSFGGDQITVQDLQRRIVRSGSLDSNELTGGKVKVSFGQDINNEEFSYEFELKEGQNFFIVMKKEGENERTVATS